MLSIKSRLILLYFFSSFLLLSAIAFFLYTSSMNFLYKADYRFLADEVERLQYIFNVQKPDANVLKKEIVDAPQEADAMYHYYVRLINAKHKIIKETPGMENILPLANKETLDMQHIRHQFWYHHSETNYLVIQSPLHFANKQIGLIQIALNVTYQHNMIHDKTNFIIIILIGTFGAFLLGIAIANRGMKSLYTLTNRVEQITSSSLNERINPKAWPSELVSLGNAFNRMLDRFEDSFSRLKQFASDLAHELRTPINNLIGETEIALTYAKNKQDFKEVLESNLEEMHRLNQLIENILYLAKTDNPKLNVSKVILNVYNEILVLIEYYQALADDKHIQLSCTGDHSAQLNANPVMFRRMINNLLSNALKYTPCHGHITCHIESKKDHILILISDTLFTNANSQAQIVFTDNTLITFRPDTKFSVDQYEFDAKSKKKSVGKYIMNLLAGGFRTITGLIARKNPDDYQVNTPVATIGVRGTDFSVVLKDGQLLMAQYEGAPCLNSTTGQTLCLSKANPYGAVPAEGANPVQLATRPAVFETKELIEPVQTPPSFDAQTVRSTQPSPPPRGTISSFCITQ